MEAVAPELSQLKSAMKTMWVAGDFGEIAKHAEHAGHDFVSRLGINPGQRVLDVACGTGNVSLPAARAGATVTGVDIAPNLLEQARSRAAAENLTIRFDEGDAEDLPYADGEFDVVMSMFGAMFAPRPERAAAELLRVCKPGGIVAMGNWTPEGFVGKTFKLSASFAPPPPGVPPPILWGNELTVRQRLASGVSDLQLTRQKMQFHYPFPPKEVVNFFRQYFGPTKVTFSRLEPKVQEELAAQLESLWTEHNTATDGTTQVEAEYLEVKAIRM